MGYCHELDRERMGSRDTGRVAKSLLVISGLRPFENTVLSLSEGSMQFKIHNAMDDTSGKPELSNYTESFPRAKILQDTFI